MNVGGLVRAPLPVFLFSRWAIAFHRLAEVCIGIGVALIFTVVWLEREATPSGKN
jgi:hypothetical protein